MDPGPAVDGPGRHEISNELLSELLHRRHSVIVSSRMQSEPPTVGGPSTAVHATSRLALMTSGRVPAVRLTEAAELGPFSWTWPAGVEQFAQGWTALVDLDGQEVRVGHGVGGRGVFRRHRLDSVTWVDIQPTVEGVEADDYATCDAERSLIKITKRLHPSSGYMQREGHSWVRSVTVMTTQSGSVCG
jgi:hypothetical protein